MTFNAILHGLAAKKRVLDFQVFYHNMTADRVTPNIQTYAAVLELYGQLNDANVIKETCVKMDTQVEKPMKYVKFRFGTYRKTTSQTYNQSSWSIQTNIP